MEEQQVTPEMLEELEEHQEDETADAQEESALNNQEFQEAYGSPEPEPVFNQHAFISGTLNFDSPEKVTYLSESELGRPLFNMRFLLDVEDIVKHYLDDLFKRHNVENKVSKYFRRKINNFADSGMSNQGFIQNMNVTKKMDMTRKRIKNLGNVNNLKGGNTP